MRILSEKDYLVAKTASLIADYDIQIVSNLYQPIIGYAATAVYLSLWNEARNQRFSKMILHSQFFSRLNMPTGIFVDARRMLEATGLLKTFVEGDDIKIYTYHIYAPKTPEKFFNDALLYGMLIKMIGEAEATRIKLSYKLDDSFTGEDISASFGEVFHPDYNDEAFRIALNSNDESVGRRGAKIKNDFSYEKFFEELSNISQIRQESISKKEMKEIERMATLYGLDELNVANALVNNYIVGNEKGKRIDLLALNKTLQEESNYTLKVNRNGARANVYSNIQSDTDLARKIRIMENSTPLEYLSKLQNNTMLAPSDIALIGDISMKYQLPNCVINALLDYVLAVNNNILSRSYMEKIAASLVREDVKTTYDAMNYLTQTYKSRKKKNKKEYTEVVEENPQTEIENSSSSEEKSWEELMKEFEEDDNNGEN